MHKTLAKPLTRRIQRRRDHARNTAPHVHFHQGPQHQPMPCYDEHCSMPRLSL